MLWEKLDSALPFTLKKVVGNHDGISRFVRVDSDYLVGCCIPCIPHIINSNEI
jgi:hypothetical protein